MHRFLIVLFSLFLADSAWGQSGSVEAVIRELHNPASKQVLVIAHRGDWRGAPENSVLAIENAIRIGVDVVEIDLKKPKMAP